MAYYQRAADVAAGMFAHAEAIRLHREALSIIATLPAGRDRDSRELAVLEAMAAPLNARHGYSSPDLQRALERTIVLAESLGRKDSTVAGMVALWATQFVQGRTADSYRTATRALNLADPESELCGQAHFAVGGSAVSLGMPAEGLRSPGTRREAGQRRGLAQHRHPPRRPRDGLCRACSLAARPGRRRLGRLP